MYTENEDDIIAQGAEAVVKRVEFLGKVCVLKRRLFKTFRHKSLDESLAKSRMVAECRSTAKLRKCGVYVPVIYLVDFLKRETVYEFVPGDTVSSLLERGAFKSFDLIGENIAKMHNANIIHGDLTTKNMILSDSGLLCLIDFGLSFFSTLAEDKAVDLYVIERCLKGHQFEEILRVYGEVSHDSEDTLKRLEEVRQRGRKRDLAG